MYIHKSFSYTPSGVGVSGFYGTGFGPLGPADISKVTCNLSIIESKEALGTHWAIVNQSHLLEIHVSKLAMLAPEDIPSLPETRHPSPALGHILAESSIQSGGRVSSPALLPQLHENLASIPSSLTQVR
jgi:hypothetical protein